MSHTFKHDPTGVRLRRMPSLKLTRRDGRSTTGPILIPSGSDGTPLSLRRWKIGVAPGVADD